ncbi:RbsD/FucU domain-containing protein [Rhizobacter sp. OV335]|uniref:RbsD/FucU domain-containing protein n=1 Tax=Rhizobacter sp. OV335 TaxID=1500264 RepID=UPI00116132BD|nr:RbsD/FucU domain-containing protein [Rhizobacter sp. OV335]
MKKTSLLHGGLSQLVAGLGHGNLVVIADAGLRVPAGTPSRIPSIRPDKKTRAVRASSGVAMMKLRVRQGSQDIVDGGLNHFRPRVDRVVPIRARATAQQLFVAVLMCFQSSLNAAQSTPGNAVCQGVEIDGANQLPLRGLAVTSLDQMGAQPPNDGGTSCITPLGSVQPDPRHDAHNESQDAGAAGREQ